MDEGSCFGLLYSSTARECQELCQVGKECKEVMGNEETTGNGQITLPCFSNYNVQNYACNTACRRAGECEAAKLAKGAVDEPPVEEIPIEASIGGEVPEGVAQEVPPTELLGTVIQPAVSEPSEPVSTEPEVSEKPVKTPVKIPVKVTRVRRKPSKKGTFRELLRGKGRYSANDLIQAVIDAGFVMDTEQARKKTRSFMHMCISEFKRKDGMNIQRDEEGKYYNADAVEADETGDTIEGEQV